LQGKGPCLEKVKKGLLCYKLLEFYLRRVKKLVTVREGMDLSDTCGLEDVLVFRGSPPWFLHPSAFWMLSLLLLSWPLRIYAECRTAMLNYQVTKLFGTCYLSPSSVNYTGPLTRTSTMETMELEAALRREQYFVVPSYSEAMLMPNATVVRILRNTNDVSDAKIFAKFRTAVVCRGERTRYYPFWKLTPPPPHHAHLSFRPPLS
uniref:Transferrin-like domain-containing protein n=1 Tax=Angiostrongylus cantonensis TaxID=6313 RepID=A0A0K0D535_ANGCA